MKTIQELRQIAFRRASCCPLRVARVCMARQVVTVTCSGCDLQRYFTFIELENPVPSIHKEALSQKQHFLRDRARKITSDDHSMSRHDFERHVSHFAKSSASRPLSELDHLSFNHNSQMDYAMMVGVVRELIARCRAHEKPLGTTLREPGPEGGPSNLHISRDAIERIEREYGPCPPNERIQHAIGQSAVAEARAYSPKTIIYCQNEEDI